MKQPIILSDLIGDGFRRLASQMASREAATESIYLEPAVPQKPEADIFEQTLENLKASERYHVERDTDGHHIVRDKNDSNKYIATITRTHTVVSEQVASGDIIHDPQAMRDLIKAAMTLYNGDLTITGASPEMYRSIKQIAREMVQSGELKADSKFGGILLDPETAQAAIDTKANSVAPPAMSFYKPADYYDGDYYDDNVTCNVTYDCNLSPDAKSAAQTPTRPDAKILKADNDNSPKTTVFAPALA